MSVSEGNSDLMGGAFPGSVHGGRGSTGTTGVCEPGPFPTSLRTPTTTVSSVLPDPDSLGLLVRASSARRPTCVGPGAGV